MIPQAKAYYLTSGKTLLVTSYINQFIYIFIYLYFNHLHLHNIVKRLVFHPLTMIWRSKWCSGGTEHICIITLKAWHSFNCPNLTRLDPLHQAAEHSHAASYWVLCWILWCYDQGHIPTTAASMLPNTPPPPQHTILSLIPHASSISSSMLSVY